MPPIANSANIGDGGVIDAVWRAEHEMLPYISQMFSANEQKDTYSGTRHPY